MAGTFEVHKDSSDKYPWRLKADSDSSQFNRATLLGAEPPA
jgi:hypothetical protein